MYNEWEDKALTSVDKKSSKGISGKNIAKTSLKKAKRAKRNDKVANRRQQKSKEGKLKINRF